MTMLSVNLNKVALLRNVREGQLPSVSEAAAICLEAGAGGITLHPRPDQRHARPGDVRELSSLVRSIPGAELNIEGYPYPEFIDLVCETRPAQCTLVPDSPDALTSDHGWDLAENGARLRPLITALRAAGTRVSLFMEPDAEQIGRAKATGADRIELYTEPYARAYGTADEDAQLELFSTAARYAQSLGLGVNAGHDLNLQNLGPFQRAVPQLLEVSIGHALISSSLEFGLTAAVRAYLEVLEPRGDQLLRARELGRIQQR
jgi:pyridoxine 5-phosphate synthase